MSEDRASKRRETWERALVLPPDTDIRESLFGELAAYLGEPEQEVRERCRNGADRLARDWKAAAPGDGDQISDFYRRTDSYLYDLTWWHSLAGDRSALAGVEALEAALEHRAGKVLDFGGGIGSLGVLYARHGLEVTLADVNPALMDYARWRFDRRGLPVSLFDTASEHLPEAAFDLVSAVDVLEHLPEPESVLRSLAAALKPGGTLFVHLPPGEDASRPMHLWHDPNRLLQELDEVGLWLEKSDGPSLTLRRGPAPRYSLNRGLSVRPTKKGWVLLSERPLMATRLNERAAGILERLSEGSFTASELSSETGMRLADILAFLDGLVGKRVLRRVAEALPSRWPGVAVIVPSRDRPEQTRACVKSLLAVDYPPDLLEVIVVDDASEAPLEKSLSDLPVRVLRLETNVGQSAARNLAARKTESEVVAFTDNDCVPEAGWLKSMVAHLCEPGIDVVGGRITSPPPDGPVAAFEAVRSPLDMGETGSMVGPKEPVAYLPTCNLAVDRTTLLRLGGFDEGMTLGEDADFVWRALDAGSGVRYEPDAEVLHRHRTRLTPLLRRRSDYASSEADLQRRHPSTRRVMMVPLVGTAALAAPALLPVAWQAGIALIAFAVVTLCVELAVKGRRLRLTGVQLPMWRVGAAVLRQHGAGLYHLGANVARYYSLPLLGVSVFWPALLPSLLLLMVVPPALDHRRLRPRLSAPGFVLLYWLELGAYQVGVWRGCVERRTLRPLLPKLRMSR